MVCFNRHLANWLNNNFGNEQLNYVDVGTVHSIVGNIINNRNLSISEFLDKAPILLLDRLDSFKLYDALIVDESQDLIDQGYLDIFNLLLDGGLKNGEWLMFGDFISQTLFTDQSEKSMYSKIGGMINHELHVCKLWKNIRNTKETALTAVHLSAPHNKPYNLSINRSGPCDINWFDNQEMQIKKTVKVFDNFKIKKYDLSKVIILLPNKYENSVLPKMIDKIPKISEYSIDNDTKYVKYATIQSFKGLEMDHVVILDINDISSDVNMALLFNAATRSTFSLTLMINSHLRDLFVKRNFYTHDMYEDEIQ